MALLDDASRLGRVASLARQGQAESRAAAAAAEAACMEVRIGCVSCTHATTHTQSHVDQLQGPFAPRSSPPWCCVWAGALRPCLCQNTAMSSQAEGDAADARRQVATLEHDNVKLAATNRQLVQRVEELECQHPGAAAAIQS